MPAVAASTVVDDMSAGAASSGFAADTLAGTAAVVVAAADTWIVTAVAPSVDTLVADTPAVPELAVAAPAVADDMSAVLASSGAGAVAAPSATDMSAGAAPSADETPAVALPLPPLGTAQSTVRLVQPVSAPAAEPLHHKAIAPVRGIPLCFFLLPILYAFLLFFHLDSS